MLEVRYSSYYQLYFNSPMEPHCEKSYWSQRFFFGQYYLARKMPYPSRRVRVSTSRTLNVKYIRTFTCEIVASIQKCLKSVFHVTKSMHLVRLSRHLHSKLLNNRQLMFFKYTHFIYLYFHFYVSKLLALEILMNRSALALTYSTTEC